MKSIENIIALIAPHRCIICKLEGKLLCPACQSADLPGVPSRCYRCHRVTKQHAVCKTCRSSVKLNHVWVTTYYETSAKELLRRFKYGRSKAGAAPIASLMHDILPELPKGLVVCHIPTANSRVRQRGYDQAEETAKELCRLRGLARTKLLTRKGNARQVGSDRNERFRQLEQALEVRKNTEISGSQILLVDDVTTTGATLEAAAKILKNYGAKTVDAVVFAQPF